ncbi:MULTISPECIES: MaoC family dehydratase [Hyphomonas]|uniref:Dehydratase n=1 Tax=Hyphomonas adhaerens TaxID=81029 RepID=A0A3B9GX63_9PROT|nr:MULTISPECIES: MaoC family dehydratase [Hyphomonas]MBB40919.1 dehydratase [Hyphomonas sp.]HAE26988.1 dehydratase [Hyphomonas adhaerens]|tara:strand:+ start:378 stop:845 length:468 start_codon:yes stop_codon:yes gene_type:complete
MRYYEDLVIGTLTKSELTYEVTREEVIDFAGKYDPQPFHLDDDAAAKTHFGRLSASGWHTAAMVMRMMVEGWSTQEPTASLGSPGVDELRWRKPVYPGDTLRVESKLIDKRRMKSRPDMGLTKTEQTVYNQDNDIVMTMVSNGLIQVRDPESSAE